MKFIDVYKVLTAKQKTTIKVVVFCFATNALNRSKGHYTFAERLTVHLLF